MARAILLVLLGAALSCGRGPTGTGFPCELPSYDAVLAVTLPTRCELHESLGDERTGWFATVGATPPEWRGLLSYQFVPGADVARTRRLIETESLPMTGDLRQWHRPSAREVALDGTSATELSLASSPDRNHYLVPIAGGTLVIHCVESWGHGEGRERRAGQAARVVAAFKVGVMGHRWARRRLNAITPPVLRAPRPVPTSIDGCMVELESTVEPETVEEMLRIPERDMIRFHHGLGTGLRNRWGLWSGSPLATMFKARCVTHPDDMSHIILTSFWRHLHGLPLDVEMQIEEAGPDAKLEREIQRASAQWEARVRRGQESQ